MAMKEATGSATMSTNRSATTGNAPSGTGVT